MSIPTAPLPQPARDALARLEAALSPADAAAHALSTFSVNADVDRAVVRFSICRAEIERISSLPASQVTPRLFDLLQESQRELAEHRAFLAQAGLLHLVEVQS